MPEQTPQGKDDLLFGQEKVAAADARYVRFPTFRAWTDGVTVNAERWARAAELLPPPQGLDAATLSRAVEIVKRTAAVETGAVEGLYDADRGFTFTVATGVAVAAVVDAEQAKRGRLVEAQLRAYDYVLDMATRRVPVTDHRIRELHQVICEGQDTYTAYTEHGKQEQSLPRGTYKKHPNHVMLPDGSTHSYCPMLDTPAEVTRLVAEMDDAGFSDAHAVLQAAYAHYCLVAIHPFADGNGRTARALASVFTFRHARVPLLVTYDDLRTYKNALSLADSGQFQPFTDFVLDRGIDALRLVDASMKTAAAPSVATTAQSIRGLYHTRGGYRHNDVDGAGHRLLHDFLLRVDDLLRPVEAEVGLRAVEVTIVDHGGGLTSETRRWPVEPGPKLLRITVTSHPPADAQVHRGYTFEVPRDGAPGDEVVIVKDNQAVFAAELRELIPSINSHVQWRLMMLAERVVGEVLHELQAVALRNREKRGY